MNNADLGYLEPCESWQVESRLFPSKAGGKPAWLSLQDVPCGNDLICSSCNKIMVFLCQIYAPYEEDHENFHRTLFIFVCRNADCCARNKADNVRIFRSSLRQHNAFYPSNPPSEAPDPTFSLSKWLTLCQTCGCRGDKKCGKCKSTTYCSPEHQIVDWKENHKKTCGTTNNDTQHSQILFPEFEIVIEPETFDEKIVDEEAEKEKYSELEKQGGLGSMNEVDEKELTEHSAEDKDKAFTKFRERIKDDPEQVLRYSRGDQPLLISNENKPGSVPDCEYCGGVRQFEFQIMPQMLTMLKENELDWGVLIFYTCKRSCTDNSAYKKEFVVKQDVSESNI